jgi:multidrug efflux pump subunit AcrA (membrane-fusion protein)
VFAGKLERKYNRYMVYKKYLLGENFMNSKISKKVFVVFMSGAMVVSLAGCGGKNKESDWSSGINIEPYSKIEYNTELVQSGDIQSQLTLKLTPEGYQSKDYSIEQSDYEVQTVNVKEGDKVEKGDVLIQFKAEEIQKTIDQYTEQKAQDEMLIDHYNRLAAIDKTQDYSSDIADARQDIELSNTYIEEQNERMKEYQVIADNDGTITYVNSDLDYGYVTAGDTLVTLDSGSSDYVTETNDTYEFKVGETYDADFDEATFQMKLVKCDKYVSDATGEDMQKLTFEPENDMAGVTEADTLTMTIQKPTVSNVTYVNKNIVFDGSDGKSYVYVLTEDGYRVAREVTVGDTVDDYTIIKSGLTAGEQVVVN